MVLATVNVADITKKLGNEIVPNKRKKGGDSIDREEESEKGEGE